MIESSYKPLAFVDGQIELEFVTAAPRRIRPEGISNHRAGVANVEPVSHPGVDARGTVEKPRKLGERNRPLVIETTRRMTFTQERCSRRDCLRVRGVEPVQIDFLSWPPRPDCRQRRNEPGIWINSA